MPQGPTLSEVIAALEGISAAFTVSTTSHEAQVVVSVPLQGTSSSAGAGLAAGANSSASAAAAAASPVSSDQDLSEFEVLLPTEFADLDAEVRLLASKLRSYGELSAQARIPRAY